MKNDLQGSSRFNYRSKRKKTNLVLNGLIGIVLLLIVFVAYSIFISGNNKTDANKNVQTTAQKTSTIDKKTVHKDTTTTAKKSTDNDQSKDSQNDVAAQDKSTSSSTTDKNKSDESNSDQMQTVTSPDASTSAQSSSSQHVTSYDSSSQDWQDMLQTMSSATGIDQGNMTVWFLGSDKSSPGGSVGTISAKDNKQVKYRVYLQYVDGQGYKATKVEQVQ